MEMLAQAREGWRANAQIDMAITDGVDTTQVRFTRRPPAANGIASHKATISAWNSQCRETSLLIPLLPVP